MSKEVEQQFVEQYNPVDDIESSHNELSRTIEYSDETKYDLNRLRSIAEYWQDQATNPIRSPRSQEVCHRIATLATFECAYRLDNIGLLVEYYGSLNAEEDLAA